MLGDPRLSIFTPSAAPASPAAAAHQRSMSMVATTPSVSQNIWLIQGISWERKDGYSVAVRSPGGMRVPRPCRAHSGRGCFESGMLQMLRCACSSPPLCHTRLSPLPPPAAATRRWVPLLRVLCRHTLLDLLHLFSQTCVANTHDHRRASTRQVRLSTCCGWRWRTVWTRQCARWGGRAGRAGCREQHESMIYLCVSPLEPLDTG